MGDEGDECEVTRRSQPVLQEKGVTLEVLRDCMGGGGDQALSEEELSGVKAGYFNPGEIPKPSANYCKEQYDWYYSDFRKCMFFNTGSSGHYCGMDHWK